MPAVAQSNSMSSARISARRKITNIGIPPTGGNMAEKCRRVERGPVLQGAACKIISAKAYLQRTFIVGNALGGSAEARRIFPEGIDGFTRSAASVRIAVPDCGNRGA